MFSRWVDGKAQVADALTKLHGDGDLLRAVCRQAFTVLVEAPEIMAARRQERRERERVPRVKSPLKLRAPVDACDITTNRDLTRSLVRTLPRHQAIRVKDKSERSVLLLPCTHFLEFLLLARLWYRCGRWRFLRQC